MRRTLGMAAATLGTVVAALIHAGQVTPHAGEHWLLAAGFLASAVFGFGWLLALAMSPASRPLLLAGLVGNTVMLAVGLCSRTVGLGPLEGVEDPTAAWVVAMCAEALVVAGCALAVRGGNHEGQALGGVAAAWRP